MGGFSLVASRSLVGFEVPDRQPRVAVRECFSRSAAILMGPDDALARGIEQAISLVADANVLVLVEVKDEGRCLEIEGWPIHKDALTGP